VSHRCPAIKFIFKHQNKITLIYISSCDLFFVFCFFLVGLGFELRVSHFKTATVLLGPHLQSIFALVILEMAS
jgi:hypothetical protein